METKDTKTEAEKNEIPESLREFPPPETLVNLDKQLQTVTTVHVDDGRYQNHFGSKSKRVPPKSIRKM
jgi:hypothetical protein